MKTIAPVKCDALTLIVAVLHQFALRAGPATECNRLDQISMRIGQSILSVVRDPLVS